MRTFLIGLVVLTLAITGSSMANATMIHDLSADFSNGGSGGTNPSADGWTYNTSGGALAALWGAYSSGDFNGTANPLVDGWVPSIGHHIGWAKMPAGTYTLALSEGDVLTHGLSDVRYTVTAATAGTYDIFCSAFTVRSPDATDVQLWINDTVQGSSYVGPGNIGKANAALVADLEGIALAAGDVVKVQSGVGTNKYTGITLTLTQVPEPASWVLLVAGLCGLGLLRRWWR